MGRVPLAKLIVAELVKKITDLLWGLNVRYRIDMILPSVTFMKQMNLVHTVTNDFLTVIKFLYYCHIHGEGTRCHCNCVLLDLN
jgi:hypothetical protein